MSSKVVEPQLGVESYSCPHCGALAHQHWYRVFLKGFEKSSGPQIVSYESANQINLKAIDDDKTRDRLQAVIERLKKNNVTQQYHDYTSINIELVNAFVSRCYSCEAYAFWIENKLLYPVRTSTITPHDEMPLAVRDIFDEAANIVDTSARGAAALLRLAIQNLMPILGEKGENLNDDIASLVTKGLEFEIQQALDIVRVIGNHAVHPGVIDLKDDRATAVRLFELVNIIVERRIATPNRIKALFDGLPPGAREAIAKRDGSE